MSGPPSIFVVVQKKVGTVPRIVHETLWRESNCVISGTSLTGKWCVVRSGVELKHQQAGEDVGAAINSRLASLVSDILAHTMAT